ncbi:GGDEF domain-containing protein [Sinimarinibacterium sp. CAU 1509]|uniref:GGDEF domain-containing protein n=1 Tax=Sinimarinibacterium sp. CAU 1509 TaxID=2562283 RepID=UPI0010ABA637|nr:GGDEF domain-containing protein [Sinimarinibacterium sp. CAU 1509]TJY59988.1 GGDEF domain-containing protein [Sinimarinibacterium sp. CAU 1509]
MFNWLAYGLVLSGVALLTGALVPVQKLIAQVPHGVLRRRWTAMFVLVSLFIFGYLGYAVAFLSESAGWNDLMVPAIFFFGAVFVWLSTSNAHQTIMDMRRVALLEQQTITDPLIGIYNRRYLDRRLDEEFQRARRYAAPLSVLMLDIDHFKHVNDTHGHQAGDLVLHHLGRLILEAIRTSDIAARFGGEEFAVIAPSTSAANAVELAERIRKFVATHPLSVVGEKQLEIRVTISIGVAQIEPTDVDGNALLCRADAALYRAKQNGRNRVES